MNTLEETIDAVDVLVKAASYDSDIAAPVQTCRNSLAALSWERYRLRTEAAGRVRIANKRRDRFVARHKHR